MITEMEVVSPPDRRYKQSDSRKRFNSGKSWSTDDIDTLKNYWGVTDVKTLAKRLKRSESAIVQKANRLGLGGFLDNSDYITLRQLYISFVGKANACSTYAVTSWGKERGLPVLKKTFCNCKFRIVNIEKFWKWAEKNRSFLDFSKLEKYALGPEPKWVKEQRQLDFKHNELVKITPWTSTDDQRLVMLLKEHKHSYADLSKQLQRTAGAIQKHIVDLGLKERPVKADNHIKYTQQDKDDIERYILGGYSYELMSLELGRSGKAIRGYVARTYGSEDLDKARAAIIIKMKEV